jgi:hypothetical protein
VAIDKIIGLIGIAVAILSAFVTIPHVFVILVVAGLIVGFWASADLVRLILTADALLSFAGYFTPAPHVGKYIAAILVAGGTMAIGASLMAILRNLYEWFWPASKTATI